MKEYEKYLKEIYDDFKEKGANKIKIKCTDEIQRANIDYLIDNKLVKCTSVQPMMDGTTYYFLTPSYEGLHYEEIKNEMLKNQVKNISNIYNNYDGKMNINSTDNSINTHINDNSKVFEEMLRIVNDTNIDNKKEIINAICELRENVNKPKYKDKFNEFIQLIANCVTIFQPFIPALVEYIK